MHCYKRLFDNVNGTACWSRFSNSICLWQDVRFGQNMNRALCLFDITCVMFARKFDGQYIYLVVDHDYSAIIIEFHIQRLVQNEKFKCTLSGISDQFPRLIFGVTAIITSRKDQKSIFFWIGIHED